MRAYHRLTEGQRNQVYALKKAGLTQWAIADQIGVNKSTISREFKRNTGLRGYRPKQAHRLACARQSQIQRSRISHATWTRIEEMTREDWSPEQITGHLKDVGEPSVSPEWIYQHIYADKGNGGDLHTRLRCQKQRRKRYGSIERRGQIKNRVSIEKRPVWPGRLAFRPRAPGRLASGACRSWKARPSVRIAMYLVMIPW